MLFGGCLGIGVRKCILSQGAAITAVFSGAGVAGLAGVVTCLSLAVLALIINSGKTMLSVEDRRQ